MADSAYRELGSATQGRVIEMSNKQTFGSELRRLRRNDPRKPGLAEMAEQIGVTVSYMSDVERDEKTPPSPAKIAQLLAYLNALHEYDRMVELASAVRKSVDFNLKGLPEAGVRALMSMARRSEEGRMTDDVWESILGAVEDKDAAQ